MKYFNGLLSLICFFLLSSSLLMVASTAAAQDHSGHAQESLAVEQDHPAHGNMQTHAGHESEHDGAMPMDTMQMEMLDQSRSQAPRDPHAYSGGYTRTEGPYSLPKSQQLELADEAILSGIWVDRLETRQGDAEDFQELVGQIWFGNSYQRVVLRTELERRDQTIEESRTELLYTRAFSPFWNLEVGGRYDHGDNAHREWFAIGVAGLAPYWIELNATAYINPEGHTAATVEAEYDLYLSQRLVLQPRVEMDFYGDSDLEAGHGRGLSKSLMGFRLRYDYDRQFSPYIGYERVHRHGEATDIFKAFNQHRENQWLAGFRFWF
ncbi:MAG: hypothetical protein PsegKO_32600 [Pseudohongiellaceae bacterium]|jgi:copper resistance protein B